MTRSADILKDPQASGVYRIEGAFQLSRLEEMARAHSLTFFHVKGAEVDGKSRFLSEAAAALTFPDYFGHNWDAFADCLTDMSWIETDGFLVLYDHADAFAGRSAEDFRTALAILKESADFWSAQGKRFFVLLSGTGAEKWGLASITP